MRVEYARARRAQAGFTLIEVVVAFAIFALAAGALFEVFAGATRRGLQARDRELLLLTAQSVLSGLRVQPTPWPAEQSGETASGESWRVTVKPFDTGTEVTSRWHAYDVLVSVSDTRARGREARLQSIELARDAP